MRAGRLGLNRDKTRGLGHKFGLPVKQQRGALFPGPRRPSRRRPGRTRRPPDVIELSANFYTTQRPAAAAARAQDNGPSHTASSRGGVPSKKALGLQLGRTVPDPSANLNLRKKPTQQLVHEPHPPTILGTLAAPTWSGPPGRSSRTTWVVPSPTQTLPGSHTLDAPRPRDTLFATARITASSTRGLAP